jgi:hypothetical protein
VTGNIVSSGMKFGRCYVSSIRALTDTMYIPLLGLARSCASDEQEQTTNLAKMNQTIMSRPESALRCECVDKT